MASKESTDLILDLLYDELSPEETLRARKLLEQNDDLQADFDRLQETRAHIQAELPTHLPTQEVPRSLHDSILAAAAAQAAQNQPAASTTPPSAHDSLASELVPAPTPRPPSTTVWSRIRNIPRAQLAAVTTVAVLLLTSAVFLRQFQNTAPQAQFSAASTEVAAPVHFESSAPAPAEAAPPGPVAMATAPAQLSEKQRANEPHEFEVAATSAREEAEEAEEKPGDLSNYDSGRSQTADPMPARRALARPATRKTAAPRQIAQDDTRQESKKRIAYDISNSLADSAATASGAAPSAVAARPLPAPRAAELAPSDDVQQAERAAEISAHRVFQDAESAFANQNYANAITLADQVIQDSRAVPTLRARALELKARAQIQHGQNDRALETYTTLQSQYPDYRPAEIERARKRLETSTSF